MNHVSCISNLEELRLHGSAVAVNGSLIEINFNRCKDKEHCNKNETEVNKFIDTHAINIAYNEKIYLSEKYSDEGPILEDIRYTSFALSSLQPITKTFLV